MPWPWKQDRVHEILDPLEIEVETKHEGDSIEGIARQGRRTKDLTKRLTEVDIAIIDHEDLDRVAAEALVEKNPLAVINCAKSISGRYPNLGPQILLEADIPVLDNVGSDLMEKEIEGKNISLIGSDLYRGNEKIASGELLNRTSLAEKMEAAKAGLGTQLELFAENTMDYMLKERELLLDGVGIPNVRTKLENRPVLVVVRGYHYKEDLQVLRPFIRDQRPVIIGVDGGADSVIDAGHKVDMIIGDMDSVSDKALKSGAELVVHAYRNGRAPGLQRLKELGLDKKAVLFPASGTSEDIAMLLADERGATVIVAVGTHGTLVEFLDKGRAGMSSTFLTRLRVGSKLVDAKGVSRLYRQRISSLQILMLGVAGIAAVLAAVWSTPGGQIIYQLAGAKADDFLTFFVSLFTP